MKVSVLMFLAVALLALSACTASMHVPAPRLPGVEIDLGGGVPGPGHCPPGQAMKGRC